MGITNFEFACTNIDESRENLRVFNLEQINEGIPVVGGSFQVIAQKAEGQAVAVRGKFQKTSSITTAPTVTEKDARKSLSLSRGEKVSSVRLVIYALYGEPFTLSWEYRTKSNNPLDEKLIYVSAVSGKVLAEIPLVIS